MIQDNLKWNEYVTSQVKKKADRRMYFVRCLSKLRVDEQINAAKILPTKMKRQYPNNSSLHKMILDKRHAFKAGNMNNYREKQTEVDEAIKRSKLQHKEKVE